MSPCVWFCMPGHIYYVQDLYSFLCRHLFVVVTTDNNTEPSQIPDNKLVSFTDPLRDTIYIAMVVRNMSGDQWEKMILLGAGNITMSVDGSSYYNAPLDREKTYFTFVRAYAYDHNDSVSVAVDWNKI